MLSLTFTLATLVALADPPAPSEGRAVGRQRSAVSPSDLPPLQGIDVDPHEVRLQGSDSSGQIIVTGYVERGKIADLTSTPGTRYEVLDPAVRGSNPGA